MRLVTKGETLYYYYLYLYRCNKRNKRGGASGAQWIPALRRA
jgi:hypothetical protein